LILGYQFFAVNYAFVITEIVSLLLLYFHVFCFRFGLTGVVIAQAIDNFIYLIVLIIYLGEVCFNLVIEYKGARSIIRLSNYEIDSKERFISIEYILALKQNLMFVTLIASQKNERFKIVCFLR
jgi:hypothetical protein